MFCPGDQVRCICAADHCWFLRRNATYTVSAVGTDSNGNPTVGLIGMARMWPASQFEKV